MHIYCVHVYVEARSQCQGSSYITVTLLCSYRVSYVGDLTTWLLVRTRNRPSSVPVLVHTIPSFSLFTWLLGFEVRFSHLCSNILVTQSFPQPLNLCFLEQNGSKEPSIGWSSRHKLSYFSVPSGRLIHQSMLPFTNVTTLEPTKYHFQ